jgi:aminopeptidase-like protein
METSMFDLITELYPICRSITGAGVTSTLERIQQEISLVINEVPTGTQILDWTVPNEWNIRDAYIKNSKGEKVIDFQKSNLHVVNYSVPIRTTMTLDQLRPHLFSLPNHPQAIPYRTSYYDKCWGFCMAHEELLKLRDDLYEVVIDSDLQPGFLRYGEFVIPGRVTDEILITTHVCHPSMCNDNLSGIAVATALARILAKSTTHHTIRFLFIPGTVGSLAWLAANEAHTPSIKSGLVLTGIGDAGAPTYKRTRMGDASIDRAMEYVLREKCANFEIRNFSPFGYDERQFCSPGFNLPVGCLMRTPHGEYPEYHTSADNLDFIKSESLEDSLSICLRCINLLENNHRYNNLFPKGEPQLGKRGIYQAMGQQSQNQQTLQLAMLWVLNQSDGNHDLLDIATRASLPFDIILDAANLLQGCQIISPILDHSRQSAAT